MSKRFQRFQFIVYPLKLVYRFIRKIIYFFQAVFLKDYPSYPMNVIMYLEPFCNLRCVQCDVWKIKPKFLRLTLKQREEIILKVKGWLGHYSLNLYLGEPLLHPQLFPLIKFATNNKIDTIITTNGTLLTEINCKKIIESDLSQVFISLDGINEQTHDLIRGVKGTFNKTTKGIERLINARGEGKKPRIIVQSLILKQNISELVSLAKWANMKVDGITFQPIVSKCGFGSNLYNPRWYKNSKLWPNYTQIKKTVDKLIYLKAKGLSVLNSDSHLKDIELYFKNPQKFIKEKPCYSDKNFQINEDGTVFFCPNQGLAGNILETKPEKIWNSIKAKTIRISNKKCNYFGKIMLCISDSLANL